MKEKKNYDIMATSNNTPHLKENIVLICLAYGFTGITYIIGGLCAINAKEKSLVWFGIVLGITFLFVAFITFFDRRKEMCSMSYVIIVGIAHLLCSVFASFVFSNWWLMGVYAGEVWCSVIVLYCIKKWRK